MRADSGPKNEAKNESKIAGPKKAKKEFKTAGPKTRQTIRNRKFYDLRRGITEDFQKWAKFQRTLSKCTKNIRRF